MLPEAFPSFVKELAMSRLVWAITMMSSEILSIPSIPAKAVDISYACSWYGVSATYYGFVSRLPSR